VRESVVPLRPHENIGNIIQEHFRADDGCEELR
jgi:hypothetical protein